VTPILPVVIAASSLLGLHLDVFVSDPWDLTADGHDDTRSQATVVAAGSEMGNECLLLEFEPAATWRGSDHKHFVATPHNGSAMFESLVTDLAVECGLVAVPEAQIASSSPMDTTWWRGGRVSPMTWCRRRHRRRRRATVRRGAGQRRRPLVVEAPLVRQVAVEVHAVGIGDLAVAIVVPQVLPPERFRAEAVVVSVGIRDRNEPQVGAAGWRASAPSGSVPSR
jgi:hypothetical protein